MNSKCNLIIGSNGFIGSSLFKSFNNTENIFTISKSKNINFKNSNHFSMNVENISGFKKIIKDLSSKYKKINIFYLVGPISSDKSIKNPVTLSFKNSNEVLIKSISNIINVLEILKGINCTFLFASSGAIYDSRNSNFFKEGDPLFPPSPYAAIKYSSEGICQSFLESFDIDIRIARIFSVYGEEMDRFFIYDVVKKLLFADAEIVLHGSGLQERDYLHVKDVVSGLKIIMSKGSPGEIYNLCSGIPFNLSNLTSKIKTYLELEEINVRWDEKDTKGIRDVWYGNNQKIKNLGFGIDNSQDVKLKSTVNSIKKRILAR